MSIINSFDISFRRMEEHHWEKIYVLIDIHDTILEACYHEEETYKWFPYAWEALRLMSKSDKICLILWTSTYDNIIEKYLEHFKENGISFDMVNSNNETKNTDISCFDKKLYFNVGIDDRFGFDARNDWKDIYFYLRNKLGSADVGESG